MKYGCVLLFALMFSTMHAFGQETTSAFSEGRLEMGLGTTFTHLAGSPSLNATGLDLGSQYHLTNWLGYSGQAWFAIGSGISLHNYLVGPEVILRRKVSPFAHVLVGIAHESRKGRNDTSFGAAVGGGVTLNINRRISWRALEIDSAPTYFRGARQDNVRFSLGLAMHF